MKSSILKYFYLFLGVIITSAAILFLLNLFTPIKILLAFAVIVAITILFAKPLWGVYTMFLFAPFLYLNFKSGNMSIPVADAIGLLGLSTWILTKLWRVINKKEKLSSIKLPGWPYFLTFVIACALSLLNTYDLSLSLKYLLRPIIFLYLVYIVYPFNLITEKKYFYNILKLLIISGAISGIICIFYFSEAIGGVIPRINPRAFFGLAPLGYNHNSIAQALLFTIPVTFLGLQKFKLKKLPSKHLNLIIKIVTISLALQIIILLLTFSRAAWLIFCLQIGILLFYNYRDRLKKFLPYLIIILILMIPLAFLMQELVTSAVSQRSDEARLFMIDKSIEMFKEHPLVGTGLNTFTDYLFHDRIYLIEFGKDGPSDAHGVIWKLISETGILGLATYTMINIWIIRKLYLARRELKQLDFTIYLVILAGILVHQIFQTSYFNQKTWLPISFILLGIHIFSKKKKERKTI